MRKSHQPASWIDAFLMLSQLMEQKDKGQRIVIFLDELPWMDTPRSKFVTAFEGFWNNWACHRHNVMVVVCGSATSWIQDKLIDNHGGLYGRVTREIKLSPFTLRECEQLYRWREDVTVRHRAELHGDGRYPVLYELYAKRIESGTDGGRDVFLRETEVAK